MDDIERLTAALKDAEDEVDELQSMVYGLRGGLEEMAASYLHECPKGYHRYCQGVMQEIDDAGKTD